MRLVRDDCGNPAATRESATMKTCTVPGCDRQHKARGYCELHYASAWNRGDFRDVDVLPTPHDELLSGAAATDYWRNAPVALAALVPPPLRWVEWDE